MNLKSLVTPIITIGAAAVILFAASTGLKGTAEANAEKELNEMMSVLLPGSTSFTEEIYEGEDEAIQAVYKGDNGYVIQTATYGYADNVVLLVGVDNDGKVTGLVARDLSETYGLGAKALSDMDFLSQFVGTSGEAEIGNTVDAMSGATVTSKAVTKGVNAAAAYVTGADTTSSATEWGG
ncbi:MAG: FMN-binding protein [Frisingicoccus sp.]|nr:FMN-binding protein [Frisingicoccus sp.]